MGNNYINELVEIFEEGKGMLREHLDLQVVAGEELWNGRFATTGLLDCLPVAQIDKVYAIALRVNPESTRPGVVVTNFLDGESMLISPDAANFVPIWIVSKLIVVPSAYWQKWASKTEAEWEAITALHQNLGGEGNLAELRAFMENPVYKNAFCNDLEGELWINLLADAFSEAAAHSSRGAFQRLIREVGRTGWTEEIDRADLSGWKEPLDLVLGVMGDPPDEDRLLALLEQASKIPSGHDAAWADLHGVLTYSGSAAKPSGAPVLIAGALAERIPEGWESDWKTAVKSLAAHAETYDGAEHFELMDLLRKKGDHAGAWRAGMTFCFWNYQKNKKLSAAVKRLMGRMAFEFFPETLWPVVEKNIGSA